MSGSALSDGTIKIKINGDNTLSSVSVDSTSRGQEALTELGKGAKSVADAQALRDKARADSEKSAETILMGSEDARLAALDAQREAVLAQIELEALPAGTTLLDRTKAEQNVSRARLIANQKARRADQPLPFPDLGT